LKSWKVPENEFTRVDKVTLRRLLTHSAGTTVSGFLGYRSTVAVPTTIQVLNAETPANTPPIRVDVEPGRLTRYSGGGFTILQQLVSDVTGDAFPHAMRELVLDLVGMTASTYQHCARATRLEERCAACASLSSW
jgi:CubicO group peptidase (beta-lactamase class C family)